MPQGIAEELIDEIRQRTDLITLVGDYLKLERRGKNLVGLCPFHHEKTPSFTVSPDKQLYHCFGCGASGNAFTLIMELEKMTFPEAARFLAQRAQVKIPERREAPTAKERLQEKVYNINQVAARYYAYCLKSTTAGKQAYNYLRKRGINDETIDLFMLGFAPAGWTGFYDFALKKGAAPELMLKAGLINPGRHKGYYDRFRNRVIFPIFNASGKVAGFGGRTMATGEKEGPKYLNSPQSPVFDKSAILYGLNLARDEIRRSKKVVVMEGYTDVIAAHQAGLKNAVASLGTALTEEQCRLLRYQADTVVTAYDSDSAGEAATWRGLAILQATGCLVQIAEMPEGSDPDSFIRQFGAAAYIKLIEEASPIIEYRLGQLKKRYDLTTDQGRVGYTKEIMPLLISAANRVEQDYYLKRAAEEIGVDENALRSELKRRRKDKNRLPEEQAEQDSAVNLITINPAEKILLSLMLQSKEIADRGRKLIESDYYSDPRVENIFREIWNLYAAEEVFTAEKLINRLSDPQVVRIITAAATDPALQDLEPRTAKRMAEDSFSKLKRAWIERRQLELQRKIRELTAAGQLDQIDDLLRESQHLISGNENNPGRSGEGGDLSG
ncbi:MAG: DNA primase [Firmicutes bacterium]|nr:DNA primase [Bacillota bacterium]